MISLSCCAKCGCFVRSSSSGRASGTGKCMVLWFINFICTKEKKSQFAGCTKFWHPCEKLHSRSDEQIIFGICHVNVFLGHRYLFAFEAKAAGVNATISSDFFFETAITQSKYNQVLQRSRLWYAINEPIYAANESIYAADENIKARNGARESQLETRQITHRIYKTVPAPAREPHRNLTLHIHI